MKTLLSIVFVLFFTLNILSQNPELVVDFNFGSDDSFSEWNYDGINFGDAIVLPIVSKEYGEELGVIKNGKVSILKDINIGAESSKPSSFIIYKDLLYFVANDGINGKSIWRTDGTENGTELFYTSDNTPRSFINANNGWLYYSIGKIIYRTDGIVNEKVYTGATLEFIYKAASRNYCKYKNGIAFVTKNSDYSFSLIYIADNDAEVLAKTESTSYFADGFGIAPLSIGLMFSIEGSNDHDGIYVYNENTKNLSQLKVKGKLIPSRRTIDFNNEINICWIAEKGYYSINGIQGEEQRLIPSTNSSATQGDTIIYAKYKDKLVFVPIPEFFEDNFIVYSDGTVSETKKIKKLQNEYLSGMVVYDKYAFIVEGTSNGFEPIIIQINLETGEAKDFYTFKENSTNTRSVRPIGIQNDYLYFISSLDDNVGAELYRIKTNLFVKTNELEKSNNMILKQQGNQFTIEMESNKNIDINIYNSIGQVVFKKQVQSNQSFTTNLKSGLYFLNFMNKKNSLTKLVYIK